MNENSGPWYLLTGLVLGLVIGLVYSLLISPLEFARIAPQSLGDSYKDSYRVLIAQAYDANGDIGRAQARLALLKDGNPAAVLSAQAQRMLAEGGSPEEARALVSLGDDLLAHLSASPTSIPAAVLPETPGPTPTPGGTDPVFTATIDPERAILTPTGNPESQTTADSSPFASMTPRITATPDALANAAFAVSEMREICDLPGSLPMLQIEVLDADGLPLPGIPILVAWDGGEDRFFTGLHPQVSPGYADFQMQPEVVYSVQAGSRGLVESGITSVVCTDEEGESYPGILWLTFEQP